MTKPCSVEVLENIWLHIRDLPFMFKEAKNVTKLFERFNFPSCAIKIKERKKRKERACREVLEAVVLVLSERPFIFALCTIWTSKGSESNSLGDLGPHSAFGKMQLQIMFFAKQSEAVQPLILILWGVRGCLHWASKIYLFFLTKKGKLFTRKLFSFLYLALDCRVP